jgi:hypothetical protein
MSDAKALFETLRASADPGVVAEIESLVGNGRDRDLCRINVLAFRLLQQTRRSLDSGSGKEVSGY